MQRLEKGLIAVDTAVTRHHFRARQRTGETALRPDASEAMQDPALLGERPSPYQFAPQLGCLVVLPDLRGWDVAISMVA